ncbi:YncE family protein [Amycolatopsis minnesotensis]|uniref:DNA-binding beta-propeller fold protein YncE n=1 Tax=Amycolatopsis minnesotensis TaxID=337894 RepID=A0ABN2RIQ8_9PSEU
MVTRRAVLKAAGTSGLAIAAGLPTTATATAAVPDADVLVLVEKSAHAVGFFDAGSGQRLATVALPQFPHELVVDSRGEYAYVGHYGVRMSSDTGEGGAAIFVLDLARRELVRTISTAPFNRVHGIRIDARDRLYALSEEKAVLLGFDAPRTDTAPTRAVHTGGIKTHLFSLSRDGERAYVTGLLSHTVSLVRPYDAATPPVVASPGQLPESSCLSQDEKVLFVGARKTPAVVALDARTLAVRKVYEVDGDPLRVYPYGEDRLLVTDIVRKTVTALSTDLRPLWSVQCTGIPSGVALHPAKPLAYVSELGTNQVSVLDLTTRRITSSFPTGLDPDSAAVLTPRR